MKSFPQFTKQQLELLIVSTYFISDQIANGDNLAKTIVDIDYCFDGMFGFKNTLDKRSLVTDPLEYSGSVFNPLIDVLLKHHEELSA